MKIAFNVPQPAACKYVFLPLVSKILQQSEISVSLLVLNRSIRCHRQFLTILAVLEIQYKTFIKNKLKA